MILSNVFSAIGHRPRIVLGGAAVLTCGALTGCGNFQGDGGDINDQGQGRDLCFWDTSGSDYDGVCAEGGRDYS